MGDVVTSAQAAAFLVEPGEVALICGGPGVYEAVSARGARPVADGDADAVLVGFHRDFDYERLRVASAAVRRGARLIATNDDATYPTPDGEIPGGGAILAAVATASGATPTIAGKPHEPMADLVRQRCGPSFGSSDGADGRRPVDHRRAVRRGRSGARSRSCAPASPRPDRRLRRSPTLDLPDLASVADVILGAAV